ncbi:hypothetical protein C0992_009397 [Termitomyces sp. T32_za158]|nr:hypothetical protein C0992_009397 [Termitomyces sp. T32_za158]
MHKIFHMDSWSEDDDIGLITGEECRQLVEDATIVRDLEDLFSFRHKDRTSHSSVLNPMESLRFRRAIYRLMLVAKTFPADEYEDEDEDEDDEDYDPAILEHDRLARKNLFTRSSIGPAGVSLDND